MLQEVLECELPVQPPPSSLVFKLSPSSAMMPLKPSVPLGREIDLLLL